MTPISVCFAKAHTILVNIRNLLMWRCSKKARGQCITAAIGASVRKIVQPVIFVLYVGEPDGGQACALINEGDT